MKILKNKLKNALLVIGSFAVCLALIEIVLRIINPSFFSHPKAYHAELGWVNAPNLVYHRVVGKKHLARIETNNLGFRDVDHSIEKRISIYPKGTKKIRRIALIGDSFSEANQVDLEGAFWQKLRKNLNRQGGDYWEIHNFGVSDYGTTQELISLQKYGLEIHPDIVILQVFPFNDILNNSISSAHIISPQDSYRPYLDPGNDFQSITYLNPKTTWLRQKIRVCRFGFLMANNIWGAWGNEKNYLKKKDLNTFADQLAIRLGFTQDYKQPSRHLFVYNTFAQPDHQLDLIKEGWEATDQAIIKIITTAQANQAKPIILVIPHLKQLDPVVDRWVPNLPFPVDPKYAESRIQQTVQPYDVPVIGLIDTFENNMDIVNPYLEGHFNAETHILVGDILAGEIVKQFPEYFDPSHAK